ncbi:hypothetical protein F4780DRAFT_51907 [Xylariomycetidae sp. FL0641]|nr:hypothetical protein F4780DRAFT_51907 [Xylariomycetidae sp. FL0641]
MGIPWRRQTGRGSPKMALPRQGRSRACDAALRCDAMRREPARSQRGGPAAAEPPPGRVGRRWRRRGRREGKARQGKSGRSGGGGAAVGALRDALEPGGRSAEPVGHGGRWMMSGWGVRTSPTVKQSGVLPASSGWSSGVSVARKARERRRRRGRGCRVRRAAVPRSEALGRAAYLSSRPRFPGVLPSASTIRYPRAWDDGMMTAL